MAWIGLPSNILGEEATRKENLSIKGLGPSYSSSGDPFAVNSSLSVDASTEDSVIIRCPLQKEIRNRSWKNVTSIMRKDPEQIKHLNRVGWSSLILAIFHSAPAEVIAEMLALISEDDRKRLLSTPVPNGSRLCLHFAARFSDNLEVFKLLVEPHPFALVMKSSDGNRPLDRAIYNRKDDSILNYLKTETKKQMVFVDDIKLRQVIIECCEERWKQQQNCSSSSIVECLGVTSRQDVDEIDFILAFYFYLRDRDAMIQLFCNVLSYVGVTRE